jgi:hypothetical protein
MPASECAASCTSRPTIIAVRDATVGPLLGTRFVSGCAVDTSSYGKPSAAAAT